MAEENNNNEIDNNVKKQNSEKVDLFVTSIDNFKELKEEVYVNKIKNVKIFIKSLLIQNRMIII